MSSNLLTQAQFLRTSRHFPLDAQPLSVEVNKSYVDIANAVNSRIIGVFPTNRAVITGESWFIQNNARQQSFRQIYPFTATGNILHGINLTNIYGFSKAYGAFTDGTNWYGAIFASNTAIAGQVSFYIAPTNIVILAGAGAPAIVQGTIVLEWLSQA
jgi:hypothetical protein